jgi:hypothetical protein
MDRRLRQGEGHASAVLHLGRVRPAGLGRGKSTSIATDAENFHAAKQSTGLEKKDGTTMAGPDQSDSADDSRRHARIDRDARPACNESLGVARCIPCFAFGLARTIQGGSMSKIY